MRLPLRPASFVVALALTGCVHHSVPLTEQPTYVTPPQELAISVDEDGTIYPRGWESALGGPPRRHGYSLLARARARNTENWLHAEEDSALMQVSHFAESRSRIFILIHGFNNSHASAAEAYDSVKAKIAFQPGDGIISFYWDGLYASGLFPPRIWFPATGYSQLAGQRGLRRILGQIRAKPIYVIAHSRGASVTLSALSDPPYDTSFARDTKAALGIDVAHQAPLADGHNHINVLLLAPAIGDIDFRLPSFYNRSCTLDDHSDTCAYRAYGSQLEHLHHSVNPHDPTLKKYYAAMASRFNATDFGLQESVTNRIHQSLPFVTHTSMELDAHSFVAYARTPDFRSMLEAVGITAR